MRFRYNNKPLVFDTIPENLGRKSQVFGCKPVFEQSSKVGQVGFTRSRAQGWARWVLYPGSKVCAPVWEKLVQEGWEAQPGLTAASCVSVHLGVC